MSTMRLVFKPGVDVESTATSSRGGWNQSNLIRWRQGFVESLLGWLRVSSTAVIGVCRAIHYWQDLIGVQRLAVGTHNTLGFYTVTASESGQATASTYDNITPENFVPGNASSGDDPFSLTVWSIDNFGQNLLAVPSGQGLYAWLPPSTAPEPPLTPPTKHADKVDTAPPFNQGGFVSAPLRIVILFGSSLDAGSQIDPLLIRWSDQSDYTVWTPTVINQSGSFRLSRGSRIVGGLQTPLMSLIWTDTDLWAMQYIGPPLIFSITQIGSLCGLISQKAAVSIGNTVYWMSDHGFFRFAGSAPEQIPCTVWDIVYNNLDRANADKCIAGVDYQYNEAWFFFPSASGGTGEIDSYVKNNIIENLWDYGDATDGANIMARTAWTDQNQSGPPITVDLKGILQQQDLGFTADTESSLPGVSIQSGYQDLADGRDMMTVDQFIPDFLWRGDNPSLSVTLFFRDFPGDTPTTMGPFTITPTTSYVTLRKPISVVLNESRAITVSPAVRAREVAIEIDGMSGWWRFGAPRLRIAPAGRI